jgi:signal recognition particle receptor subunit beta
MQFNLAQREITLKIVYYGPALSGKTTNLQSIHKLIKPEGRGRLMTLDTRDDRTLFFDLLPVFFETASGFKVKLKLFTVPGQVIHNSTRRIVLAGADGVAFIADSQRAMTKANNESWANMHENLKLNGLNPDEIPAVIQFNKRDLRDIKTDAEVDDVAKKGREPVFRAIATQGAGVMETLFGLLKVTWVSLNTKHNFEQKFRISQVEFLENIFKHMDLGTGPIPFK